MAALTAAFVAAAVGTILILGGAQGLVYVLLVVGLSAAGLPLGFALFGRAHAAGWLAGLLLGYAATTMAVWAVVFAARPSIPAFALAWLSVAALIVASTRGVRAPLVALPVWTNRDSAALLIILLLAPVLLVRPFARLGAEDEQGGRQYRAYFIADFVWHTALTAELTKQAPRPTNPLLAPEPLHYYWTYFRTPASIAAASGFDVQTTLKLNALLTALALLAAIYLAAWTALPEWPLLTAVGLALTALAPSIEGVAAMSDIVRRGLPLSELRDINIDAVAAWAFKGLRIDNLPRTMWYTPQHGFSCALGLLTVPVALAAGIRARAGAIAIVGIALGASLMFNPLLGAAFCAVYGLTVLIDWRIRGERLSTLVRHTLAILPVGAALGWCQLNAVGAGAGEVLRFGFSGLARHHTVLTFLLQFGPILLPMTALAWTGASGRWQRLVPGATGVMLAVLLMHLVALTVDPAWVGFRGGNLFFVFAPALVAMPLARLYEMRQPQVLAGLIAVVALAGLPTTIIDAYNAQDVSNRGLSREAERARGVDVPFDADAEFHWTMVISRGEGDALSWVRHNTAPDAVVQFEPHVRGREMWGVIPAFAERRLATGNPIPLLATPVYAERNVRVRRVFSSTDARSAWSEARALDIDYIFLGPTEREAYPSAVFGQAPDYFTPVFTNAEAAVYAVRP